MVTVAIVCPACKRVLALGATLPASCFGAVAPDEVAKLDHAQLDAHPKAHHDCVELEVTVPDGLEPSASIGEIERAYAPQLAVLGALAASTRSERQ
jgi:hypothetical protein